MVSSSTALARRLLARPPCAILTALGKQLQYEVRVPLPLLDVPARLRCWGPLKNWKSGTFPARPPAWASQRFLKLYLLLDDVYSSVLASPRKRCVCI